MASDFSVRFLGTRGSIPATGPDFNDVGGATSCVVVEAGSRDLIFDAGSGLTRWSDILMERYQAGVASLLYPLSSGPPHRASILLSALFARLERPSVRPPKHTV
jgi:hypothetical protein